MAELETEDDVVSKVLEPLRKRIDQMLVVAP
jgi:hypothetical protein